MPSWSDPRVATLIAELATHKARGDLAEPYPGIPAQILNVAMDIRVNEHLARLCFPESPPIVRSLYAGASMPGILLLPPWDLARRTEQLAVVREAPPPGEREGQHPLSQADLRQHLVGGKLPSGARTDWTIRAQRWTP